VGGTSDSWVATVPDVVRAGFRLSSGTVTGLQPPRYNTADGSRPPGWGAINRPGHSDDMIYTPADVAFDLPLTAAAPSAGPGRVLVAGGAIGCDWFEPTHPVLEAGRRYRPDD
jgi:hypothetical protein